MIKMKAVFVIFLACFSLTNSIRHAMYTGIEKYDNYYNMPKLPFKFSCMEPWINADTMKAHYMGIHAQHAIVMNRLLKHWRDEDKENPLTKKSLVNIIKKIDEVPYQWRRSLQRAIGGYINHLFYFASMSSNPEGNRMDIPKQIRWAIYRSFVNIKHFEEKFENEVTKFEGNGFVWLCRIPKKNYVTIFPTIEDNSPLQAAGGLEPLLGIDLWEHAYHMKHPFDRKEYLKNWWKTVDWQKVNDAYIWWENMEAASVHDEL